jgi:hypothetical protein
VAREAISGARAAERRPALEGEGVAAVVSPPEWGLCAANLVFALVAWISPSRESLATLVSGMTLVALFILILAVRQALRTGRIGQALLHFGIFVTYWVGLGGLSATRPAFMVRVWQIAALAGFTYSPTKVGLACVYVALFQLTALLGLSIGVPKGLRALAGWRWDRRLSTPLVWMIAILAIVAWLPLLVSFEWSVERVIERQLAMRSAQDLGGGAAGLLGHITHFAKYATAVCIVLILVTYGKRSLVLWAGAILGGVFFFLQGTRHHLLFVAVPVAVYVFRRTFERARRRDLLLLVCVVVVVGLAYQLQTVLREKGWSSIRQVEVRELFAFAGMDHADALMFSLTLVPKHHDYFHTPMAPFFVTHFIPRRWWPSKPFPQFWLYYNRQYTRGGAFNVTPSYIGQSHMNWGLLGVFFGALWMGWLTRLADAWLLKADVDRQKMWIIWVGSFYGFLISMHRIYYPLYFVYAVFAFVAMLVLTRSRSPGVAGAASAR